MVTPEDQAFVGPDISELSRLANRFRAAIVASDPKSLPASMRSFPRWCCGEAALLLAKYLEENGHGLFNFMLGERKGFSHAWLQRDGLIIDITGDQFSDQKEAVIVTRDGSWHAGFYGQVEHVADFSVCNQYTVSVLQAAYKEVKEHIEG